MKRIFLSAQILLAIVAMNQTFAQNNSAHRGVSTIQQINVTNVLWNPNGTAGAPGMTQTSVLVSFHNGGAKPCFTTTLAYDGMTTVLVGSGQACVAAVTSVSFAPVAGPSGNVYAAPTDVTIDGSYFVTQMLIDNGTDPVFDTTNGLIKTQGVVQVTSQGQ
jgi:hypothetical protein